MNAQTTVATISNVRKGCRTGIILYSKARTERWPRLRFLQLCSELLKRVLFSAEPFEPTVLDAHRTNMRLGYEFESVARRRENESTLAACHSMRS